MITQNEVLAILSSEGNCEYLNDLAYVHKLTKHYLLIAEELSSEGTLFLQPLKEHRDAHDHLSRIFGLPLRDKTNMPKDVYQYISDNLSKAFGHEYRAFFDTVDWLTFICRKYIRESLAIASVQKRYAQRFDFASTKKFINQIPFDIAEFRERKDVNCSKSILLREVDEYEAILKRLIEIYGEVQQIEYK